MALQYKKDRIETWGEFEVGASRVTEYRPPWYRYQGVVEGTVLSTCHPDTLRQRITVLIKDSVPSSTREDHYDTLNTTESVDVPYTEHPRTDMEFVQLVRELGRKAGQRHNVVRCLEGLQPYKALRVERLLIDLTVEA